MSPHRCWCWPVCSSGSGSPPTGRAAQLGAWAGQVRALAVVVGLVGGIGVFMLTGRRDTREFLSESRFELRKVVWPTRQEAIRMTWVVIVVVLILSCCWVASTS
jgi:preprotein translocase subunit SecE